MKIKTFQFGLAVSVFFLLTAIHLDAKKQLTPKEAEGLVQNWLASQGYDTRSSRFLLERDPDREPFLGFYFYSAAYEQSESAPTLGHFAVNRDSADVWDWELCKKLQSPTLLSQQKVLRDKLGLSRREYARLSKIAPCSGPT